MSQKEIQKKLQQFRLEELKMMHRALTNSIKKGKAQKKKKK